jgi:hypothetical protein
VLDKGIVIDAWVRVSLVGIDLITVEARVVVASIDTYLKYAEAVGQVSSASRPALEAAPEPLRADHDLLGVSGIKHSSRLRVERERSRERDRDRERAPRKAKAGAPRRKRPARP